MIGATDDLDEDDAAVVGGGGFPPGCFGCGALVAGGGGALDCSRALAACVGDAGAGVLGAGVFAEQAVAARIRAEKNNARPRLGTAALDNFHCGDWV